ncbi:ATP-dependent helicase STH1/SNF2 [Wickerhamomyces ciferrii]|uniref:ATP-dependent helicase STH1/SNF2 n=1 Tax=Wickerhamomyces ciferrii (strain ATCC 14091 / BCRC 22168 / CBS 111 / JCM 3599 / NBRC 0793 / NRRL Y-1031 F-60-10) TaxID=1206466 RepID=K0KK36_WICCF|nr:ATP-dependent helicase STH1/SNF2 [Wickerhamomyces ciferrii]CCH41498.1 ATP-dependent helicase STH1/SNF2 [Wickerhamomyces ciferrii]
MSLQTSPVPATSSPAPTIPITNGNSNVPKSSFNVPFPKSRHELELLVLRYRSLHILNNNPEEEQAIEKVLFEVSQSQEKYKSKLQRLRDAQKKSRDYNQNVLCDQITTLQLLSKDIDLPEGLSQRLNIQAPGTESKASELVPIERSFKFAERVHNLGIKDQFTNPEQIDKLYAAGNPNAEKLISTKISSRITELEKLPANLGTFKHDELTLQSPDDLQPHADDLKIRALLELKSLRLLTKQKSLRQNLLFSIGAKAHTSEEHLKNHPITLSAQRSLHIRPKVVSKQTAKLAEELERQQELEKQRIEHARHIQRINNIVNKANVVITERVEASAKRQQFARSISQLHSQIEKDESKKLEKTAKQRLQALKSNDEEAYLKLLDQTKDTRITHLLGQTNQFLDSLAQAVQQQQTESKLSNGEILPEEFTDEDREKIDYYEVAHKVKEEVTKQPSILVGGQLKEYQLKGLQWMVSLYNNHLNGILADEMGLGKTIQSLSLITYLIEVKKQPGPYLVIVPLSTITNWTLEFEKWAPSLKTIVYKGTPNQRKNLGYEVRTGNFNVLLTTYEYIIKDRPTLSKLKWVHMIIDEGHRMKNTQSKLSSTLTHYYHTKNRLILTGTPLQNNLPELWALLNFVLPKVFNSVSTFDEWFNTPFANTGGQEKMELSEEETLLVIRRLHKVLRPFLLRRLKKEVEKDLPDKVEKVVKCKLSGLQYVLYQQMLKHNALFVGAGATGATKSGIKGLNNKIMQLRKICNHPFVFEEVENVINPTRDSSDMLWRTAGKFELLDRILPKFKKSGHRILMFFQMTQVMDIMEDFLRLRELKYMRLDGSTKADDRQGMLKVFNNPDSEYFCFLLSTRAGGLGLNLQSADTVIIFDSDWNPHQDLQAQDRAHRIGQKNEVRILRLITSDTVEEVILERALQKLDIDGKVIQAGKFDNKSTAEEQEMFLKKLLENEGSKDEDENQELDDDELNEILARNDDERELFAKMDLERITAEKMAQRQKNGYKERLLTEGELPEIFREDITQHLVQEEAELGRTREKKRVFYDDGLTEEQWLLAMDDDEDTVEAAIERKRRTQEKRKKRLSTRNEESASPEPVVDTPRRPKRSRSNANLKEAQDEESEFEEEVEATPAKRAKKAVPSFVEPGYEFLNQIKELKDEEDDHLLSEYFIDLPSRKLYPDYYQLIQQPVSIESIRKNIKSGKIKTFEAFKDAVYKIFTNAKFYNEEGSSVYEDAVALENYANSKFEEIEKSL